MIVVGFDHIEGTSLIVLRDSNQCDVTIARDTAKELPGEWPTHSIQEERVCLRNHEVRREEDSTVCCKLRRDDLRPPVVGISSMTQSEPCR